MADFNSLQWNSKYARKIVQSFQKDLPDHGYLESYFCPYRNQIADARLKICPRCGSNISSTNQLHAEDTDLSILDCVLIEEWNAIQPTFNTKPYEPAQDYLFQRAVLDFTNIIKSLVANGCWNKVQGPLTETQSNLNIMITTKTEKDHAKTLYNCNIVPPLQQQYFANTFRHNQHSKHTNLNIAKNMAFMSYYKQLQRMEVISQHDQINITTSKYANVGLLHEALDLEFRQLKMDILLGGAVGKNAFTLQLMNTLIRRKQHIETTIQSSHR